MKRMLSVLICAIAAFPATAATYYVDKENGNDANDGKAPERAFKTANKGFYTINISENRGSELIIAPGKYPLTSDIGCNGGGSEVKRSRVRSSTDNPDDVVLYSDGTFECLRLGGFITVSGITLSNGVNRATCPSGGIRFSEHDDAAYKMIVSNCVVTCCNNIYGSGTNGAAVAIYGHNLMIDSVIRNNTASNADGAGVLIMNNNSFKGVPRLERCRIEGNVAKGKGGGVYVSNAPRATTTYQSSGNAVEIVDCEIIGNSAANGAGIHFATTNMTAYLTGCVISNNTATTNSGGLRLENGANLLMNRCRVEGNVASSAAGIDVVGKSAAFITTLTCTNTIISKNMASNTGAGVRIINNYGQAFFTDTVFCENSAVESGGGAYISGYGKGVFDRCRFDGNSATITEATDNRGGGGIFVGNQTSDVRGYCAVSNCVFASNMSGTRAGGMGGSWNKCYFGGAIVNCVFTNNSSRLQGGGLVMRDTTSSTPNPNPPIIRNCLFAFNRTTQNGGATDASDANGGGVHLVTYSDVVLENCTIVSNSVGNTKNNVSGGIHHRYGGKLKNCIVAYNTVNGVSDAEKLSSGNTSWTLNDAAYEYCCGWPAVTRFKEANHCIAVDPKFVDPANGDFRLAGGSPCIDAGVNADWMAGKDSKDLAGNPRIYKGAVDIGCYELWLPPGLMILLR